MIRKVCSVLAALTVAAGLVAATSAASEATSFTPRSGHYVAAENYPGQHGSAMITFEVKHTGHGLQIQNFKVGHQGYGNAMVGSNHHFNVCNHHWCYKGLWYNDQYVSGSFKPHGSSHWTEFLGHPRPAPGPGMYAGSGMSHPSKAVDFTVVREHGNLVIKHFEIGGHVYGNAHVHHDGTFDTSHGGTAFKGFWHTSSYVYGQYRLHGTHTWVGFVANAYDF